MPSVCHDSWRSNLGKERKIPIERFLSFSISFYLLVHITYIYVYTHTHKHTHMYIYTAAHEHTHILFMYIIPVRP